MLLESIYSWFAYLSNMAGGHDSQQTYKPRLRETKSLVLSRHGSDRRFSGSKLPRLAECADQRPNQEHLEGKGFPPTTGPSPCRVGVGARIACCLRMLM